MASERNYTKEAEDWAWAAEESRTPGSGIKNTKRAIRQFQDLCAEAAAKAQQRPQEAKLMAIDNRQVAKAIAALYRCTSDGDEWTDTDEMIQQAAFALLDACGVGCYQMAGLLMQESTLDAEVIADFCDTSIAEVYASLNELWLSQQMGGQP